MKIAFKLMLLLALFNFIGCNTSIEERIEKEFLKYAEENFDDPDAIEKIKAIDKISSKEIEKIIDECDSLIMSSDGVGRKIDSCEAKLLVRAGRTGDSVLIEHVRTLLWTEVAFQDYFNENEHTYYQVLDSVNKFKSMKDTMNMDAYIYTIKVRVKDDGKKHLKKFYSIIYNDVIRISEREPSLSEFPLLDKRIDLLIRFVDYHKKWAAYALFKKEKIQEIEEGIESFELESKE